MELALLQNSPLKTWSHSSEGMDERTLKDASRNLAILVLNVGSTSLKYAVVEPLTGAKSIRGLVDRIGQLGGDAGCYEEAIERMLHDVDMGAIDAVGHRVVHGGAIFPAPTRVTAEAIEKLRLLDKLAPLHNPPARQVVENLWQRFPAIPATMVFDTAYFSQLPEIATRYAVPDSWYSSYGIRRYGAHGTSHSFVVQKTLQFLNQNAPRGKAKHRILSLHLGGGSSITASIDGIPVDTSMGFTPLEGIAMGTRSGDVDPGAIFYMQRQSGWDPESVETALLRESGMKGLCGESDMRRIEAMAEAGDRRAKLAIDLFVRRIQKCMGAYIALMEGVDSVLFTAGIGENSALIRSKVISGFRWLGFELDEEQNVAPNWIDGLARLSPQDHQLSVFAVRTDEEWAISRLSQPQ